MLRRELIIGGTALVTARFVHADTSSNPRAVVTTELGKFTVEVSLDRPTAEVFDKIAEAAQADPNIVECHMVAGGFDYLMKVRVADMDAYRRFLGHGIARLPGVRETRTYVVIEKVKSSTLLPTEP